MDTTSYRLQLGSASIELENCQWLADAIHQLQALGIAQKPTRAYFLAADGTWLPVADLAIRAIYRNQHY